MPVSLPRFIKKAFATDGLKTSIPEASNNTTGRAGYDQGFPPINMQPIEAGGIPPDGTDMNGVLYDATLAISYIQSGKSFPFNSDFATAIGGYPIGAVVSDASNTTLWLNGVNNNSAFPAGWTNFSFSDPTETVRGSPLIASRNETISGTGAGKMIIPGNISDAFGVGQFLADYSGNRAMDTIYQNTTPRPICIYIGGQATVANTSYIVIRVGQSTLTLYDASVSRSPVAPGGVAVNAIVPPGGYYSASSVDVTGLRWREMRN